MKDVITRMKECVPGLNPIAITHLQKRMTDSEWNAFKKVCTRDVKPSEAPKKPAQKTTKKKTSKKKKSTKKKTSAKPKTHEQSNG